MLMIKQQQLAKRLLLLLSIIIIIIFYFPARHKTNKIITVKLATYLII